MPPLCNSQDIFLKDTRLPGSKRTERNGDRGRDDRDDRGGGMKSWGRDGSRSPPASRGYGKGGYGYGKGKDDYGYGKSGKGGYWVFVDSSSKGKSDWEKGDRKGKSRDPYSSFGGRDYKGKSKGKDSEKGKGKRGGKRSGDGDVSEKSLDDSLEAYFGRKASSAKPEAKERAAKGGKANDKDLDDQLSKYMGNEDKKADEPKAEKEVKEDAAKDSGDKPEEKPAEDKADEKKKEADAAEGTDKEGK